MEKKNSIIKAINKNVRTSPRKLALVCNFIKGKRADIALTVGFPSLAGMAASQIEFFGSEVGSALFEEYQEILDCSSREVWMVTQKRVGM